MDDLLAGRAFQEKLLKAAQTGVMTSRRQAMGAEPLQGAWT